MVQHDDVLQIARHVSVWEKEIVDKRLELCIFVGVQ